MMNFHVKGVMYSILILMDSVNLVSGGKLFKKKTSQSDSEGVIRLHDPNSLRPGKKFSSIWPSRPFRGMSIDDTANKIEKSPKANIGFAEEPTTSGPASFEESEGTGFGLKEQQATPEPAESGEISETVDEPVYIELPTTQCKKVDYYNHFLPALKRRSERMTRGTSYADAIGNVAKCFFDMGSLVSKEAVQRFLKIEKCFKEYLIHNPSYSLKSDTLVTDFFVCLEKYRTSTEYTKNFEEDTLRPHPSAVDYPLSTIIPTSILRKDKMRSKNKKHVRFNFPGEPLPVATEDVGPDGEPLMETNA
ncbi:hypothetical protein RF11_01896 [Thelohanellus kitauei]|uniref:Uncharacterized protein n=1 Tax=Thelohanellus kitauei TaxID=669202 RepID=A0A0C2MQR8_THEKT|nr:hypothetical protein RF11_01896 [Thelohanellus kitauei]